MKAITTLLLLLGIGYTFADTCSVNPANRTDCGWYGIDEDTCEVRSCCWDEEYDNTAWCFYPTDNKCYGIDPHEREDCGYFGIQREKCEKDNGCCFDHTVPNVPWCFKGNEPTTEAPSEESTPAATAAPSNGTTAAPTEAPAEEEKSTPEPAEAGVASEEAPTA